MPDIPINPVVRTGPDYLRLATALLQQMRLDSPTGGIWEAADVQWWSRQEQSTDRHGQLFWLDGHGQPRAAVLTTDFRGTMQCDALLRPADRSQDQHQDFARTVWRTAINRPGDLGTPTAEFPVRPDDAIGIAELTAAGLHPQDGPGVIASWLPAADRPAIPPLPHGYQLLSRADAASTHPSPLIARNGPDVEHRLRQCSLYRPELDLSVIAPDGQSAGYGLFWPDPVTGVGLVEPVRTEAEHQGLGIASHLLAVGLNLLAAHGCTRLKVSNDLGIYRRTGFQPLPTATATIYSR